jgi:hypothetical protein
MGIFGRFSAALATTAVLMAVLMSASVGASTASADPYSARINTKTVVTTPSPIRVDTRVDISVKVTANSPQTPTGTVTLNLSSAPDGAGQTRAAAAGPADWSRTIQYGGGTEHVTGPAFPKTGDWLVTAVFHPDGNTFRGSRDGWIFEVIDGSGGNPDDDGDDDNGLLPDTGGPALLWLLLGVGLVGGGGAAIVLARRRRTSTPVAA